jgi:uncharacterized protein (UPF0332 family)
MMPSTAFADLRLTPYVIQDAGQRQKVAQDVAMAEKSFEAMKVKAGAEVKEDVAVTMLAYQTMYQSAKALVHAAGYEIDNFRALLSALHHLYVQAGRLDAALIEALQSSQAIRPGTPQYVACAERWLHHARQCVNP